MVKEINAMYAIIDIETTGGKFDCESITEIAIIKYNGEKLLDQFSSLVNPEKKIDSFVEKLTGINSKILKHAPKFYNIAKRIIYPLYQALMCMVMRLNMLKEMTH